MKRVQGGPSARVTGSLAKGAACSFPTPLREAVARHSTTPPSKSVGSRREPAPSAAEGVSAHSAYPRVQESAMVSGLFSLASRSRRQVRARNGFVFVLSHVVYSAAHTTPSSPWLRVDATLQRSKNPNPNPLKISASGSSGSRAARQPRPAAIKEVGRSQWCARRRNPRRPGRLEGAAPH